MSTATMSLSALPTDVLSSVYAGLTVRDLLRLEQTDSGLRTSLVAPSVEADAVFLAAARGCWTQHLGRAGRGHFNTWRAASVWLEQTVFPTLAARGVKPAARLLVEAGLLTPGPWGRPEMYDLARTVLGQRDHLNCRRRVAAFVCSRDFCRDSVPRQPPALAASSSSSEEEEAQQQQHPVAAPSPDSPVSKPNAPIRRKRDNLHAFIASIDLSHTRDPEEALRELLLRFPFLPIDAGEGADRVIKAAARVYLHQHPTQLAQLEVSLDGREHRDPDSVIYILLYSIIMLNTDLHNVQIKTKMTQQAYIRSVKSTVLADVFSDAELGRMYHNVRRAPLRIERPAPQRLAATTAPATTRPRPTRPWTTAVVVAGIAAALAALVSVETLRQPLSCFPSQNAPLPLHQG